MDGRTDMVGVVTVPIASPDGCIGVMLSAGVVIVELVP